MKEINTEHGTERAKPNDIFKYQHQTFNKLVMSKSVMTKYPIVNMSITNDSKSAITITKKSDQESLIKFYNLESKKLIWEEVISGDYIKVKEVEQNSDGSKFACVYFDNGKFYMRSF